MGIVGGIGLVLVGLAVVGGFFVFVITHSNIDGGSDLPFGG